MGKKVRVGVSLMMTQGMKDALDRACELQRRSRADFIVLMLEGYLPTVSAALSSGLHQGTLEIGRPRSSGSGHISPEGKSQKSQRHASDGPK
jgi:hypothetical protein